MLTHSPLLFPHLDQPVTLALRPMQISGAVTPVEDADGGINIAVVEESASGVLCVIVAYLAMLEGDEIVVYWDDIPVFTRTVETGEKDKHLFFYLPKALFTPGLHECFYELTRFGASRPDDPSVASRFFVKLTSPGGRDREPHLPDGHSELHIAQLPQEIIDQGVIDADWAKKGVPLTVPAFPEIRLRDTILMRWGSHTLAPHLVTLAQAEGKDPIVIVAKQEDILAGGDSAALEIMYDPHDEVLNWSSRHSKRTRIAVDAGAWRLAAPIIKESINGIITIIDLNKEDVTVQVHIEGSDFALNDSVKMTWIGTPFTGKPLIHTETKPVGNIPSVMEFDVPYAQVRAIAMGRADASYVLTKADGSKPLSSKRKFADVVGDVSMPYAPTIVELLGDILESFRPYATVLIKYLTIANGDLVAIHWIGEKFNGQPYVHEFTHTVSDSEAKEGFFTAYVDAEHIIVLDKGKLNLWYTVSNDKPELYGVSDSEHLLVKVQAVTATLARPEVEEADKDPDVLDPSKVFDVVHILIENPPTQKDDFVTWYWQAPDQFGSICDGVPITSLSAGKSLRFRVPEEYVTRSIGQYVKVRYVLWRPSTQRYEYSATLILLIGELVGELLAPKVIQAPDDILNPKDGLNGVDVRVSYENMKPVLDKINLSWIGTPGAGTSTDLELPGDASGTITFHIDGSVIGANIDRRVSVGYGVTRYGFTTPSESLDLYVSNFEDPQNDWPRPQVPLANNDVLDLMMFIGDARALVLKWPFIALKQRLWLRLEGKTAAGSDHVIRMLDGDEITLAQVGSGLNEVLLRSELMKLGHSTPANVICKVSFDGSDQEVDAIEFPGLPLTIRTRYDWLTPKITHVTDANGEVTEGGKTFFEQVTVEGSATQYETVELFDGSTSHGNADVGADGVWRKTLLNLQIKDYHITAHALYAADPVFSLIRAFTVMAAVPPTITDITDSKSSVPHNGITFDTSVIITGKASPGQTVQLYDGTTAVAPVTDVDANGDWSKTFTGLSVAPHNIKAKALYGAQPESAVRIFTVAQTVTPTITNVTDSKGSVPHNGTTFDTSVTVTGKASPGQTVQLYDGVTAVAPVTNVDANGDWSKTFTGLSVAPHNIKAKALYGAQPESAVRIFTVAQTVTPTITNVTDSKGSVPHNGITFDTSVTITGKASPGQTVQLYDGTTAVAPVTDVDANGDWSKTFTGLSVAPHNIKAKALYGAQPESAVRIFTVAQTVTPTITNVTDSKGSVPHNGTTFDTSVTVIGKAGPGQTVQLYDGATAVAPVTNVDANGDWSKTFTGLSVAPHNIKARALYGAQPESAVRSFTVAVASAPSITNVTDSKGSVPHNGTTFDTSVTVIGKAGPGQTVQLYDGTTAVAPVTNVDANGDWSKTFTGLSVAPHNIKAKALYGAQPESAVRIFTVAVASAPSITNVTDSKGSVPHNGTTFDTSVTVTGKASAGLTVQLYDGATAVAPVTNVDANGDWSKTFTGLSVAPHNIKAKALYGAQPESAVRIFTVAVASAPSITNVTDSKGSVPHNGTTFDTSVTVTGKASAGQTVQLYDGVTAVAPVTNVDANGDWSKTFTGLSVAPHNIKARALYGAQPESAVRSFTVAVASAPSITNVTDSKGSVPHNGTTFDTSVTITGKASPGQTVQLYDGTTAVAPVTDVDANGDWSKTFTGLSVAPHNIKAKALYGAQPESAVRIFTVAQTVTPTITNVTDSKGSVPHNGTTFDTSVTVIGKAGPGQTVQLYDGATAVAPVTNVDANGDWSKTFTGLSVAPHNIKARALYGAQPESAVRSFTVAVASAPSITNVTDSKGSVPHNGTTFDTSVTVIGKAGPGQTVQLYDGATAVAPVTNVDANGDWSKTFTGLSVAPHNIKAKALYGAQPESAVRIFTVAVHTAPSLDSVRDSRGELSNNGTTTNTSVTLQGRVTPLHDVRIYDGSTQKHVATALNTGIWNTTLAVGLGGHTITARAVTTGQTSNARSFTVISPIPPLNFNTSPVTLSGKIYLIPGSPQILPAFGPGTSVHHQASGGQPGYRYSSNNTAVAHVDSGNGLVTVRGRGTASITVTDAANQSKSYTVTVTGVIHCIGLGGGNWTAMRNNAANNGARLPSLGELREIYNLYGSRWPMGNYYYWSTDLAASIPIARYYMKNLVTGTEAHVQHYGAANGVGIK